MTTPSRWVALEAFDAALGRRLFLDEAMAIAGAATLSSRDRAFARRLLLTTFRRLGEIDALLAARLDRPPPPKARRIRHLLRLGVAELAFLGTPPHAAVGSAVSAAKSEAPKFSGLVNAVLRRIARETTPPEPIDAPQTTDDAKRNTPGWLWAQLAKDWGRDRAAAIAAAQLSPAPLDLTPRDPDDASALAEAVGGVVAPSGSVRLARGGDPTALPGFDGGWWWVQDAAAALPAKLLDIRPGERAIDLCAAPGGKTLQLAAAGADVLALDVSADRLARVRDNLKRCRLSAEIVADDALTWRPAAPAPAVLLDAPCSASGTIRRHPEGLWIKDASALDALVERQDRLLDAAWEMTAPGGRLVYCTCSLFKAEGEARAKAFLARWSDARLRPLAETPLAQTGLAGLGGALRTTPADWPGDPTDASAFGGGLDGFYAARFDKAG